MSFANDSCGPSSALQNLSKHAQVDRSLQQDHIHRAQEQQRSFRSVNHNPALEQEFNRQANLDNNVFQNAFSGNFQGPLNPHQQHVQKLPGPGWVNDFSKIALADSHQQHQQQQHSVRASAQLQQESWNSQFLEQQRPAYSTQSRSYANRFADSFPVSQGFMTNPTQRYMTEHQQLHRQANDYERAEITEQFDHEFSKVQEELVNPAKVEQPENTFENPNKQKFAIAASEVVQAMNTTNNEKFKNSKFLQLMSKVAEREVELSNDETKLVDKDGHDINEDGKLPDPLENIEEGELNTPYQSALLISERNNDGSYSWDDMYGDKSIHNGF